MKKLLIIIFLFALIDGLYSGQGPLEDGIDVPVLATNSSWGKFYQGKV